MDHAVGLDRLPDGLTFPPELGERIWFDEDRKTLSFRGFMSKADFDRLNNLSDHWGYRRSLESLFRICIYEDNAPRSPNRMAGWFARIVPKKS